MFKVVTRTHFPAKHKEAILAMSRDAIEIAKKQPGFESIRIHLSTDGTHTLTYWEWATEQDHLNCTQSPDWGDWNPKWTALMSDGASFDIGTYGVFASS